jgi:hypothetical protein
LRISKTEEANGYQQTVQNAFREVDDALLIYTAMSGGWVEIPQAKEPCQPMMAAGFILPEI